jgi:hypothetical protein
VGWVTPSTPPKAEWVGSSLPKANPSYNQPQKSNSHRAQISSQGWNSFNSIETNNFQKAEHRGRLAKIESTAKVSSHWQSTPNLGTSQPKITEGAPYTSLGQSPR